MTSIQSLEPEIAHSEFRMSSGVAAWGREGGGEWCFRHWWQSQSGGKRGSGVSATGASLSGGKRGSGASATGGSLSGGKTDILNEKKLI